MVDGSVAADDEEAQNVRHRTSNRRKTAFIVAGVVFAAAVTSTAVTAMSAFAGTAEVSAAPLASVHSASTVYSLTVDGVTVPVNGYTGYDYAQFSMRGPATVVVTKLNGTTVSTAAISPIKQGYRATVSGATATFTMRGPEYLIVKLDGQRQLILAADPTETDKPTATGEGVFNVTGETFGADPTGAAVSTTAVQQAIDAASAYGSIGGHGPGTVYIPQGLYPVGNLTLKSNTAVYLEAGAVLRVVADKSLYTMDAHKDSQNRDLTWWIRTEVGSSNIKLYGRGTLDGNGMAATKAGFGMNVLVPIGTSNFTLDGLTIREGASWTVMPVRSDHLTFTDMKIFNRFDMGENDAFDANESQDVTVRRGVAVSLDDTYSTKSWPKQVGITKKWPGDPEEVRNATFDNLLAWTICYAYKLGQGVVTDHDNVTFKNSVVYDASIGVGVHHRAGSGTTSNVLFSNIDIERITWTNDKKRAWATLVVEDALKTGGGRIAGVRFSHINVRDKGTTKVLFSGFSDTATVTGISFDAIRMPGSTGYATTAAELNLAAAVFADAPTIQGGQPPVTPPTSPSPSATPPSPEPSATASATTPARTDPASGTATRRRR
jgi:polygalacturonase